MLPLNLFQRYWGSFFRVLIYVKAVRQFLQTILINFAYFDSIGSSHFREGSILLSNIIDSVRLIFSSTSSLIWLSWSKCVLCGVEPNDQYRVGQKEVKLH